MPPWKRLLLNLYYRATYPARAWNLCRAAAAGHLPAIVLCWHRIADDRANPWTVSYAAFARQISWLGKRFQFVSLEEIQRRIRHNSNFSLCVSVTFDDGYADNCRQAIPLLIERQIPCTYFVTVQNAIGGKPFSHDLAMGRCFSPNTPEELRSMAAAGVEIGAHGYTHADLGALADRGLLDREIVEAKRRLQEAVGRPVRYFAFPFGLHANLNQAAFALAEEAGYAGVCSAYGGFNFPGDDPFHLQRIVVDDFIIRLKNWVTMDPRKTHTPRFQYERPALSDALPAAGLPCSAAKGQFAIPNPQSPIPNP